MPLDIVVVWYGGLQIVLLGHILMCDVHPVGQRAHELADLVWQPVDVILSNAAHQTD